MRSCQARSVRSSHLCSSPVCSGLVSTASRAPRPQPYSVARAAGIDPPTSGGARPRDGGRVVPPRTSALLCALRRAVPPSSLLAAALGGLAGSVSGSHHIPAAPGESSDGVGACVSDEERGQRRYWQTPRPLSFCPQADAAMRLHRPDGRLCGPPSPWGPAAGRGTGRCGVIRELAETLSDKRGGFIGRASRTVGTWTQREVRWWAPLDDAIACQYSRRRRVQVGRITQDERELAGVGGRRAISLRRLRRTRACGEQRRWNMQ